MRFWPGLGPKPTCSLNVLEVGGHKNCRHWLIELEFESDTLLFPFCYMYVCDLQSSFCMNFKLNELFYNIFLMF